MSNWYDVSIFKCSFAEFVYNMCFKFHSTIQVLNQFLFLNHFLIGHRFAVLKWCDRDICDVLVLTLLSVCMFSAESWIISFFNNVGIYWDSPAEEYEWGWFGTQKAYIWWVLLPAGELDSQYIANLALGSVYTLLLCSVHI